MQNSQQLTIESKSGYFHIWISAGSGQSFFYNDDDKAYFLTLIQDALSPRTAYHEASLYSLRFAQVIDLLAYSLTSSGVHLLVHTTSKDIVEKLGQRLLLDYLERLNHNPLVTQLPFESLFTFDYLTGRHQALQVSKDIHLFHENWRYDRYSSIGFYIDDRRGDWMRPYRLTSLFEQKPHRYIRYLRSQATESDQIFSSINHSLAHKSMGNSSP